MTCKAVASQEASFDMGSRQPAGCSSIACLTLSRIREDELASPRGRVQQLHIRNLTDIQGYTHETNKPCLASSCCAEHATHDRRWILDVWQTRDISRASTACLVYNRPMRLHPYIVHGYSTGVLNARTAEGGWLAITKYEGNGFLDCV